MPALLYVRRRRAIKGPFKQAVLKRLLDLGKIVPSDQLSNDRVTWKPVGEMLTLPEPSGLPEPGGAEAESATAEGETRALPRFALPPEPERGAPALPGDGPERGSEAGRVESPSPLPARNAVSRRVSGHPRRPGRPSVRSVLAEPGHGGLVTPRLKQIVTLAGVMALIVFSGLSFLPEPEASSPACDAPAGPAVNWSNCRMSGRVLSRAELGGARMRAVHLAEARLTGARLTSADLAYADLFRARLGYVEAGRASFQGANLREADLSYANLRGADFSHADLTGANLGGTELHGARFDRAIWMDGRVCLPGSTGGCRLALLGDEHRLPRAGSPRVGGVATDPGESNASH